MHQSAARTGNHVSIPSSPAITKPLPKPIPQQEPEHIFKANPIKIGKVFQPVYEHKHTEPLDLHLHGEEIRKQKLETFEAEVKRQRFLEAEQRKFIANPLPSGSPDVKHQTCIYIIIFKEIPSKTSPHNGIQTIQPPNRRARGNP